jgi:hypothetical protein
MALIEMTHPKLPGQVGSIDEDGFPEFAALGWVRVPTDTERAAEPAPTVARKQPTTKKESN